MMTRYMKNCLSVIILAVCASLGTTASDALSARSAAGSEQQVTPTPHVRNGASSSRNWIDVIPLKRGFWEQTVFQGTQSVNAPYGRVEICPDTYPMSTYPTSPFPSYPATENLGQEILQMVSVPDYARLLADGRYRVFGGVTMTLGGSVTYVHLVTLHGDDHYDDVVTATFHARTHPVKHVYSGNGHWVAPCPVPSK